MFRISDTTPVRASQRVRGMPQRSAAAATSISLATAPALRCSSQQLCMLLLAVVPCRPFRGSNRAVSIRTLAHATSSSSATSIASAVVEPWPISVRTAVRVIVSSSPIVTIGDSSGVAGPAPRRRYHAASPPVAASPTTRKPRRLITGCRPVRRCGSRAGSGHRSRTGRCCRPSRGRCRRRSVAADAPAAPRHS